MKWKYIYPEQNDKSLFRAETAIYLPNYSEGPMCIKCLTAILITGICWCKNYNLAKISINQSMTKVLAVLWYVAIILLNKIN